jgi:hypothetical protein
MARRFALGNILDGAIRPVEKTEDAELRCLADVTVVQAADLGERHDLPRGWELDRSGVGCVLGEREMGARLIVVREVSDQDAAEVALAEHEYVVQALAKDQTH